ncbi:MAG: LPS assembly protein LptD [Pseudomonadota bacterium]
MSYGHDKACAWPLSAVITAALLALSPPVWAQDSQQITVDDSNTPIFFTADELIFERNERLVIARGNVEIIRDDRVLIADEVRFDRDRDLATAKGNVTLTQEDGNVLFADEFELTGDLREGFAERLRVLLEDDSRLAAVSGERLEGNVSVLNRAVYSPCHLCEDDPDDAPLWQIKADRIVHDETAKDIVYRDASIEFFGVPVFYTPYFAHPDPTVFQRTGLLSSSVGTDSDLGSFVTAEYYFAIDETMDATATTTITSDQGALLGGEVRKRFNFGDFEISGSVSGSDRQEGVGSARRTVDDGLRGHIFSTGRFDLSDHWRSGFDVALAADDTFLREFNITDEDTLDNRGYVEYFNRRSYASVEAFYFQDLRPNINEDEPIVAPYAQWNMMGDPRGLLGGRWHADLGLRALTRNEGADNLRFSGDLGWERRFISQTGLVADLDLSLRGDTYVSNDLRSGNPLANEDNDTEARFLPQAQLTFGYPLAREAWGFRQTIEPMLAVIASPEIDDDQRDLPNEDSTTIEFDFSNLFSDNRFPGDDRLESGTRVVYGARFAMEGDPGIAKLFLGQSHRFSGDGVLPQDSGLEDRTSDIVGGLRLSAHGYADVNYLFRFDDSDFGSGRHEVTFNGGIPELRVGGTYLFSEGIETTDIVDDRQQLFLTATSQLTDHWSTGAFHRRDLGNEAGSLQSGLFLSYQDECFVFSVQATRDFTLRDGLEEGDSIFFRFALKNLGEFQTPSFGLDFLNDDP